MADEESTGSLKITGTCFGVVINNPTPDDYARCNKLPGYVTTFKFQDEIGEKTGTLHINGTCKTRYTVHRDQVKKWLPRARITFAQSMKHLEHLEDYAHKEKTGVPGTQVSLLNEGMSCKNTCILIADEILDSLDKVKDGRRLYDLAITQILIKNPDLAGALQNPSMRNFWISTKTAWIFHATKKRLEAPTKEAPTQSPTECIILDTPDQD